MQNHQGARVPKKLSAANFRSGLFYVLKDSTTKETQHEDEQ